MSSEYLPQLIMRRSSLTQLPPLNLPLGYTLHRCERHFSLSEQTGIAAVLGESFPEISWSAERVVSTFLLDSSCWATLYLRNENTNQIVATATARADANFPGAGYLHWVGVAPSERGQGLGYQVSLAVLYEFARVGNHSAVLNTDDHRTAAIKTYLRLYFLPVSLHHSHASRWRQVMESLEVNVPSDVHVTSTETTALTNA